MKKSTLKLTVHYETLRMLAGMELVRVTGGDPASPRFDTGNAGTGCPNVALLDLAGPVTGCPKVPALVGGSIGCPAKL